MEIEECQELKNIKYKSMLLSGVNSDKATILINANASRIDSFLEKESKQNKNEPWNKLDKTAKIKQLNDYADMLVTNDQHSLNSDEIGFLKNYLIVSLDKKKLQCVKDVQYDKNLGKIKTIPCLHFNPVTRKFTLKRSEKRVSTTKSLGKGIDLKKKIELL
jgi:hypothetical protein